MAAPIVVGSLFALLLILGGVISAKKRRALAERESEAKAERPAVSVVVIELESQTFVDEVSLPGVVDPWKDVWVAAQVAGIVVGVSVVEGDTVARGAPLCRIDDRDYVAALAGADAGADAANSAVGLAALQFERMAKLRRDGTVGQAEYDAAEAAVRQARASFRQAMAASAGAKLALERTVIRAPMTGFVSRLPATVGILLSPGARVARIVDTTKVRVNIGIPERDLLAVGGQKKVDLTFSAIPDHKYVGKRIYLGIEPEDRSRTYKMQLAIDNRDGALRPGMFAKGRIIRGKPRDAILVPLFAVIPRAKDKIVFVEEDGVARRRIVETGVLQGKKLREARVEITGGLAPGDRLIVVGHRQVEDGDRVTISEMPSALRDLMQ
jgi:membrane fusion protein (multidrug efflux system)